LPASSSVIISPHVLEKEARSNSPSHGFHRDSPLGEGALKNMTSRRLEPDRLGRLFIFSRDGENATGKSY